VLFGILGGQQVKASLSPAIHNLLYRLKKTDALYTRFPTDDLADAWRSIKSLDLRGISVTAPFKRAILAYADAADPVAKKLESANTLVRRKNGSWMAHNTDAVGFLNAYPFLEKARAVAVLGAGGVVPAVLLALKQRCPSARVTVYARSPVRAARALGSTHPEVRSLRGLKAATADVIICAISEDIAFTLPRPTGIARAIDLRYGSVTRFMKTAKRKRYIVSDGLQMLVHQAIAQHELFTGNHVSPAAISSLFSLLSSLPPPSHGK
jgi:shikimate dehydrogenase